MQFSYKDLEDAVDVWLKDFCDPMLSGPDLIADAIYSASLAIRRFKKENEVLKYNQYNSFEKYAHQINQDLLCNEIDKLKAQRNALQQYIINLRRNFSEPSEN
tara:strand:+ start:1457 stop:1765 length:309 start_codon:yes stop_codon:yes gene_type:complete